LAGGDFGDEKNLDSTQGFRREQKKFFEKNLY
jgi:hypothetical protein